MSTISDTSPPAGWVREQVMRKFVFGPNEDFYTGAGLRALCRRGEFPHLRIANRYLFRIADVLEFLRRQSTTIEEASNKLRPPHGNLGNQHAVGRAQPGKGKKTNRS
jgi:hypothetical protein